MRQGEEAPEFQFSDLIAEHLPPGDGRTLLEVGCAPGRILAQMSAQLGFEAHGIDYAGDPDEMVDYLGRHGAHVGAIENGDFLTWDPGRTFDVVLSHGVIEHFDDPMALVDRHFELTTPGGRVVIGVPNFRLGQNLLHWTFDRENLRRHNLACMRRSFFEAAARRHRARVLYLDFCGGHYDFWRERPRSVQLGVAENDPRLLRSPVSAVHLALKALLGSAVEQGNPVLSPYLLGIFEPPA